MDVLQVCISLALLGLFAAFLFAVQEGTVRAMDAAFADQEFQTSAGPVRGRDLRVVRRVHQSLDQGVHGDWWYCVAPGPRWLLVISQEKLFVARGQSKWVVRELTEGAMRAALAGDAKAIAAAFAPAEAKGTGRASSGG